ncbi:FecCD family ABC transporter permease [Truepera radiovictrix]|uniref:Transport system permease protein n=1 Tax=Truepera radiovictrix (strain DSM 17093 / CIP 108686 / LMG 22925 / RQ-24) TaxID=649638 RepID=D7CXD0_TRURR|nr:iron ABC transporter permease [Truepera radiovictrix]ADI13254.1 transport system permease protein [Truepera radiovictrix DSM 17093]WMT58182.1 iron ABC transporter permease [Truepera radiovictrix]
MSARYRTALVGCALALPPALLLAAGLGAFYIPPLEIPRVLLERGLGYEVLTQIRLPRVLMTALVGAGLAVAGAVLQGLFRNPLAEPSLIGVSSGAALGAAVWIVLLGGGFGSGQPVRASAAFQWGLPLAAFVGACVTTLLVWRVARTGGRTLVVSLLLAGIAMNSLAGAGIGLMQFFADDQQLRSFVFWTLGGFNRVSWREFWVAAPLIALALALLLRQGRRLNALVLGESEAYLLGVQVERVKRRAVVLSALLVGASVAVAGVIGFVGLVVPHMFRLVAGPDHRYLLPGAALMGASLLLVADVLCRTLLVPAELPIGILTALVGGPFFIYLLTVQQREVLRA